MINKFKILDYKQYRRRNNQIYELIVNNAINFQYILNIIHFSLLHVNVNMNKKYRIDFQSGTTVS